jgi:transposase
MLSTTRTGTLRLHYDTTSINVTGEYDSGFNTRLIQIVQGHSKDHRSDLKQFIISLVTNQHGIPLFMEPLSGNESDKKTLLRTIEEVRKNLVTDETIYHMADSALYSADNVARLGDQCFWITRVPETIKEVQTIVQSNPDWISCQDRRYKSATFTSSYGGIPQRWVLFRSEEQYRKSLLTYEKNQEKDLERDQTALHKLCVKGFACEADARMTVEPWLAKYPRYSLENLDILEKHQRSSGKLGRRKKDEPLERVYHVHVRIMFDPVVVSHEKEMLGRFLLGGNDPTIDPDVMLEYYKEQSTVERGFRFIKDDRFHVSKVYLENENRIAALAMIMVLCLMVYSITAWQFRNTLRTKNATIRDQYKKPTRKPSAKWLYFLFRRVRQIDEIVDNRRVCQILNYTSVLVDIVHLLGPPVEKYYSLKN